MPTAPRIALVSFQEFDPCLRDGGTRGELERLILFRQLGAEVSILSFMADDEGNRQALANALASGLYTDAVTTGSRSRANLHGVAFHNEILPGEFDKLRGDYRLVVKAILAQTRELEPDLIFTADQGYSPLLAAWLSQIPGAHSFHSAANLHAFAANTPYTRLLHSRRVFANSEYLRGLVTSQLGVEASLWHEAIWMPEYVAAGGGTDTRAAGRSRIGFYAGHWAKGDPIVSRLAKQLPECEFVVTGQSVSAELAAAGPNVACLGHVTDMRKLYAQIDLLLVPSLKQEEFGRVLIEAAANGIPAIANRVGGIPEALGDSGVLVECGVPEQADLDGLASTYADTIRRVLRDPALYADLRRRALLRAEEFSRQQERMARTVLDELTRAIPRHG